MRSITEQYEHKMSNMVNKESTYWPVLGMMPS